ncbi:MULTISPECIES: hypothetical protein [Bacillus cereus group]|uniref:hypothetical protein n=1 Tax=Bacillus cereus group TaxID=86661 RepID=UPI00027C12C2|nr:MULTISPECIES: hypothetical protein [Bacillus cereus group]EJV56422.1 hypothetical protein IEM_05304 [Bacillus cereus BAG6O-2]OFD41639.1 hypothetical protein BWGOE2_29610 [Bacillus mycoides]OFD45096.1 hypothetical protein BWGOE1_30750 [Bacillus mycoides]OFD57974.1 hypothetical protein BWGOE6_33940 [Bacillus mycoides]OFD63778.1 hypothetical protein BWGOE7_30290 [Bacillus mycoides]
MDKENLLSEQINRVPSDALNTPSKEQEQMLETSSQVEHNPNNNNNNVNKKDTTQDLYGTDLPISDVDRTTNQK